MVTSMILAPAAALRVVTRQSGWASAPRSELKGRASGGTASEEVSAAV